MKRFFSPSNDPVIPADTALRQTAGFAHRTQRFLVALCRYGVVCFLALNAAFGANPIQTENALPGTTAWQITNPATNREIEGYASLTSVNKGGQISLFVSTSDTNYTINVYRVGWYNGAGARQLLGPIQRSGVVQTIPVPDPNTGFAECNWTNPYVLTVPNTWVSGVYLAQLIGSQSGKQAYIVFVVRDESSTSTYLFQCAANTYEAYNNWPSDASGQSTAQSRLPHLPHRSSRRSTLHSPAPGETRLLLASC